MIDIYCRICENLVDEVQGCKCYGSDAGAAVRACAADDFENYAPHDFSWCAICGAKIPDDILLCPGCRLQAETTWSAESLEVLKKAEKVEADRAKFREAARLVREAVISVFKLPAEVVRRAFGGDSK